MKRLWIPAAAAALLVALAGTLFVLREEIANFWIKRQLAGQLSRALGAEVDLHGVSWKNGVLHARRFRISGGDHAFALIEARDVRAVVDWNRLLEPSREPLQVEVAEADLVWRAAGEARTGKHNAASKGSSAPTLDVLVGRLNFRQNDGRGWKIAGAQVRGLQKSDGWSFSAKGGTVTTEGWPVLQIERLSAETRGGDWHIGGFALRDAAGGVVAGSARQTGDAWAAEFSWQDLDLATIVPSSYAVHLGGKASGDAVLKQGALTGRMKIDGAETKAVGLMAKLADLIDHEDWEKIPWQLFRFDFARGSDGSVAFSDLQALSPKGLAVRGSGHYAPDGIGADLQVGVRAAGRPLLGAFVPVLFSHERDGYYWTQVKVGGTAADPTENLSARVATAMALAPATEAARSAVEIPGEAAEAVGGMLRDLLRR